MFSGSFRRFLGLRLRKSRKVSRVFQGVPGDGGWRFRTLHGVSRNVRSVLGGFRIRWIHGHFRRFQGITGSFLGDLVGLGACR